jgi:hypothetical protein
MMNRILSFLTVAAACISLTATAGTRSSPNYSVITDTVDAGGRKTASANYSNDGSIGGIGGISTAGAPVETIKHSYIGQLYELTGIALAATPTTVNEGATRQITANAVADDASTINLAGNQVAWSVVNGPITSINANGLATAGIVYQNESATVRGAFQGTAGTLGLTVVNVNIDNFGSYAGDAVDDLWQVQNFGLNNPDGLGSADPDGDGQNNLFEYTAGTVPTDAASRFRLRIDRVVGQPDRKNIVFSPRFPTRTYTVQFRDNLSTGSFASLAGITTTDNGTERTVTDLNATGFSKFYRVSISFP